MQKMRMMQTSCFQAVANLFRDPPTGFNIQPSLTKPWNVYGEAELRNPKIKPTFPYLYLVDANNIDLNLRPPTIVLEFRLDSHFSYSLGAVNPGKAATLTLHCIGRNKAESMDIASYVADNIQSIPIYDYNNPATPPVAPITSWPVLDTRPRMGGPGSLPQPYYPLIQYLQFDPFVSMGSFKVTDKQRFQGMMTQSEMVQFRFLSSF